MSLDLYIHSRKPIRHRGTGVMVRDNGVTRELQTVEEVRAHFPDAQNLDKIRIREWEDNELFHANMTHNLGKMAGHVPLPGVKTTAYELLWHPEQADGITMTTEHHRDEDDGYEWDEELAVLDAEYVRQATEALLYVGAHREELEPLNPDNGWGSYDVLHRFLRQLVHCLLEIPAEEYEDYQIESNV